MRSVVPLNLRRALAVATIAIPILALLVVFSNSFSKSMPALTLSDGWITNGPEGGVIAAVAVDPVNSSNIYAGTSGGLFKSTNSALTWSALTLVPGGVIVESVAVDPKTPTTVYVGTNCNGVLKSTDGGVN